MVREAGMGHLENEVFEHFKSKMAPTILELQTQSGDLPMSTDTKLLPWSKIIDEDKPFCQ